MTGKVKHSENYNLVARKSIFNLIIRGPNEHVHRDHNKTVCGSVLTVLTISCNKNSTLMIKVIGFMNFVIFVNSSVIGTEQVLYFSVFSPRQLNSPSNSFASSFIIK